MKQWNAAEFIMNFFCAIFACLLLFAVIWGIDIAIGQTAAEVVENGEVTPEFLALLAQSLGGIKGAGTLGAAGILVQLIIKALDQPFANRFFSGSKGLTKIAIVAALTFAVTPIGLMATAGLTFGAAAVHSTTLTAFMVFLNQIHKHATEKSKQRGNTQNAEQIISKV